MRTAVALAILLGLVDPAAVRAETRRTAVIVVGADAVAAGALQQRLESSLDGPSGIQIVPRGELAIRLAAKFPPPRREESAIAALFLQAREAYFDDRLTEAMERVESANRFVKIGLAAPGADRVTVLTWRSALYLAMDDRVRAEAEARSLLALSPEVKPDLDVFRPSFGKFIDELRSKLPAEVEVSITGAPPGSRLLVDDRFVESRFRIAPGAHKLHVRTLGFQPMSIVFDAKANLAIKVAPALDIAEGAASSIESAVWKDASAKVVAELGKLLGVDEVVAVSIRADGAVRALALRRDGDNVQKSPIVPRDGVSELIVWLRTALGTKSVEHRLAVSTVGHVIASSRRVSVRFDSNDGFETALGGSGGAAAALAEYGGSRGELLLSAISYQGSKTKFETAEASYTVNGGSAVEGRLLFSHSFDVWHLGLRPNAGVRVERDSSGGTGSFAAYPAYTRADAIAGGSIELGFPNAKLESGGSVSSNLTWRSTNGWGRPRVPFGVGWFAGIEWRRRAWAVGANYSGEQRASRFAGEYPIAASTALRDPEVIDARHLFSLSVGYRLR